MVFKKIRLYFLIIKAFLVKEKKIIFLSGLLSVIIFSLITYVVPYIPRPKTTEKIGLVGNYVFEDLPLSIVQLASSGLTKIGQDGKPLPSLAEKWKIEQEGKVYLVSLANNIFWQDGTPVKAEEINYNFENVTSSVIDSKTIKFTLKEPFAPFLNLLSQPIFKQQFVGTGRYQIKKLSTNGPYVKSLFLTGPDKNIVFSFYPTTQIAVEAFRLGEVNQLVDLNQMPFDKDWQNFIKIETKINKDQYVAIFLNLRDKLLSDKNLRQALAYATPKPNDQTRVIGPINPDSWAYNDSAKLYTPDTTQANRLLEKFKADNKDQKISLKLETTTNLLSQAEEIKKSWQSILDIDVEVKLIDRVSSDFQTLLITTQIPSDPDQYSFWHSTQKSNLTSYKSPKVDKLLEDARRISDFDQRREKYLDFQKFLVEDCPVIFLYHPQVFQITRKTIIF
jgi:peptide/nickel transport system substrate-binding protein